MEKKEPIMRKILKFLLDNTMVEFSSKEIAESIRQTGISYHTSRLKAFVMNNRDASDILQVRVAKGRESVFMCKAKTVDDPEGWATKLYQDYLAWERGSAKRAKPEAITKHKEGKAEVSVPVRFVYNNEEPVEIPVNIRITISVDIADKS